MALEQPLHRLVAVTGGSGEGRETKCGCWLQHVTRLKKLRRMPNNHPGKLGNIPRTLQIIASYPACLPRGARKPHGSVRTNIKTPRLWAIQARGRFSMLRMSAIETALSAPTLILGAAFSAWP